MKSFYEEVYEIVSKIPEGKVATYGQIALMLGKRNGARAVGWAMRATPKELNIPCHRVVNKIGQMSPSYVFGSPDIQKEILKSEKITFKDDGCIDMEKHLWSGEQNI